MRNLYEELFPDGTLMYSLDDLNTLLGKLSVDVSDAYLNRDISKAAMEAIEESETFEEYMDNCRDYAVLTELEPEEKQRMWDEFFEGKRDEQVENEVDDFRMKDDDMVK